MHFGDVVSLGQAGFISLFSMFIVFLLLLMIAYVIKLTAKIMEVTGLGKEEPAKVKRPVSSADEGELVAVIAAAVAAAADSGSEVRVKSVTEVDRNWTSGARSNSVK